MKYCWKTGVEPNQSTNQPYQHVFHTSLILHLLYTLSLWRCGTADVLVFRKIHPKQANRYYVYSAAKNLVTKAWFLHRCRCLAGFTITPSTNCYIYLLLLYSPIAFRSSPLYLGCDSNTSEILLRVNVLFYCLSCMFIITNIYSVLSTLAEKMHYLKNRPEFVELTLVVFVCYILWV